jgi:hypothetical protein
MIPTPKPDRVKGNPALEHARMREKARAGKLRGKEYPKDQFNNGTTAAQSVNAKVVRPEEVITRASKNRSAKTGKSSNEPGMAQYKPPHHSVY